MKTTLEFCCETKKTAKYNCYLTIILFLIFSGHYLRAGGLQIKDTDADGVNDVVLNNGHLEVVVNVFHGGVISSIRTSGGREYVPWDGASTGALQDCFYLPWQCHRSGEEEAPYWLVCEEKGEEYTGVRLAQWRQMKGLDGIRVDKTILLFHRENVVYVKYRFNNESPAPRTIAFWSHSVVNPGYDSCEVAGKGFFMENVLKFSTRMSGVAPHYNLKTLAQELIFLTPLHGIDSMGVKSEKDFIRPILDAMGKSGIKPELFDGRWAIMESPDGNDGLALIPLECQQVARLYSWQGWLDKIKGHSFEIIFQPVRIKPGEFFENSMLLKVGTTANELAADKKNVCVPSLPVRSVSANMLEVKIFKTRELWNEKVTVIYGEKENEGIIQESAELSGCIGASFVSDRDFLASGLRRPSELCGKRDILIVGCANELARKLNLLFSKSIPEDSSVQFEGAGFARKIFWLRDITSIRMATAESKVRPAKPSLSASRYLVKSLPEFFVWKEGSTTKIFEDEVVFEGTLPTRGCIDISLAKNEFEPFQLILTSKQKNNLDVEITPLTLRSDTGDLFPADNVVVNKVAYIPVEVPTDSFSKAGAWPDPLLDNAPTAIVRGKHCPFWITVYAPKNIASGRYFGGLEIKYGGKKCVVPLQVSVRNFALPIKANLRTTIQLANWGMGVEMRKKYGYGFDEKMCRKNYMEHRINDFWAGDHLDDYVMANSQPHAFLIKYYEINSIVKKINEGKKASIREKDDSGKEVERQVPFFSDEWRRFEIEDLRKRISKYKKLGILQNGFVWIGEEPAPCTYPYVSHLSQLVKEADVNVKRALCDCNVPVPIPELYNEVDIWVAQIQNFHPERARERQAKGEEVWLYSAYPKYPHPQLLLDYPAICHRIIFWMLWKYQLKGFHFWGSVNWSDDPWKNPWTSGSNGDGYLLYPTKEGKPLNSIRWELMRDGIDDYDYFCILNDRIKRLKELRKTKQSSECNELIDLGEKSLKTADSFIESVKVYVKDPDAIYQAREAIGELIERIDQACGALAE
ncbi:MAG: DUF4091 domain-containing protein [Verrucomicrobiae bacterium]|nr:DUF4091 domain-containing protein [Verrucomicrobiae bacterium]